MEINEIVSAIESLTLIQASELVKALEEKFGVSAAAPVAAAGVAGAPAAAAEEKTEFDVVLAGFDAAKKVAIIKAVHCISIVIWACKKPPAFGRGLNFREREIT